MTYQGLGARAEKYFSTATTTLSGDDGVCAKAALRATFECVGVSIEGFLFAVIIDSLQSKEAEGEDDAVRAILGKVTEQKYMADL